MTVGRSACDLGLEGHARPTALLGHDHAREQALQEDRLRADVAGLVAEPIEGDDVLDKAMQPLGLLVDVAEHASRVSSSSVEP